MGAPDQPRPTRDEVRAAGGVVWRRVDGRLEVLLVHRPRYGDWSLPKGKLDPGESFEQAAVREVTEETGLRCHLGSPLPEVRYDDRFGRSKVVRYWAMEALADDGFAPNDEVDELRWTDLAEARSALSYERDRAVLEALPGAIG
jgi:8-oxo-dGTP pyrophosphatase MutT (NUDIX family)